MDDMFDRFKMNFPCIAKQVVSYEIHGRELLAYLDDGSRVSYYPLEQTIRTLPKDAQHMSEVECRREFGVRLRRLLVLKSMTQEDLSKMTGIRRASISDYVMGRVSPSFYNADKIAKALGVSLEEFRYL